MALTYPTASTKDVQTSWTSSEFKLCEVLHYWTLSNFRFCPEEMGKPIKSSVFGSANGPYWVVELYPRGETEAYKGFISLYLNLHSLSKDSRAIPKVNYKFSFWDSKKENIRIPGWNSQFELWKGSRVGEGYGLPKLIRRDVLIELLKDNEMTICCEIVICGSLVNSSRGNFPPITTCTLSHDHELMFNCQKFGDVTIEVKDKEFLAYQGILETRSPVFAAMFQHEMAEQRQNRVIIKDFEPRVVEEMLIYIYTGRSPNLEELASDLLSIAEKYNLERLKLMSQEALSRKLNKENAIEILTSADLYRAKELKTFVIMFIITNSFYFLEASIWKNIILSLQKHPNLTVELTRALFASKK